MTLSNQYTGVSLYLAPPSEGWRSAFSSLNELSRARTQETQLSASRQLASSLVSLASRCDKVIESLQYTQESQKSQLRHAQIQRLGHVETLNQFTEEKQQVDEEKIKLESRLEKLKVRMESRRYKMQREAKAARRFSRKQKLFSVATVGIGYFFVMHIMKV